MAILVVKIIKKGHDAPNLQFDQNNYYLSLFKSMRPLFFLKMKKWATS